VYFTKIVKEPKVEEVKLWIKEKQSK
jgi:hypothetical protein